MDAPAPVSIDDAFDAVTFLPDRTPEGSGTPGWFAQLGDYRDGAVFVAHYAGNSEWERHGAGDEIVMTLEGSTTMFLLLDGAEIAHTLGPRELIIVPQGVWHRFETPEGVKIMSVTPQPTDHQIELPGD